MAHRRSRPTFAEQLRDVTSQPVPSSRPVTPGRFDRDGGLSTPDGILLRLEGEVTPQAAQDAIRRGALLAWEPCGCGGGGRCQPEWVTEEQRARLDGPPELRGRRGTPTWLARWTGPSVEVVLAHGDVVWGEALA